jgi:hypothetical protein
LLRERTRQQSHRPAYLQIAAELQNAACVGGRNQRLDHSVRDGMWLLAPHHQSGYPESAIDTAPLMPSKI